uniref:Morc S5 domain-containing protein n=1 Tax=Brassica oleracea var. oleracea TaxID=109376 RepID=A0A0D3DHY9_BRAOL
MGGPQPIVYESSEDLSTNLNILLKWSQFEDIGAHGSKVVIYNLWLNDEGIYELSFDDDDEVLNISLRGQDKRLRDESVQDEKRINSRTLELRSHISYRVRHSLRAYTSMLYLKMFEIFKIILRGIPVVQCEEYTKKETEMEQTVRNLEKELEEAKSKCAQLSLLVDAKRKEMQQV